MTSFSIESGIKPRLAHAGGSIALLALLARCSKTLLGEAANGTTSLNRETALRVDATLKDLEAWIASIAPLRPDMRDARAVESWLEDFRSKRTKAAQPDPWSLLIDLSPGDIDSVLVKNNWSREQLLRQLTLAQNRLHEMTSQLAAHNTDREQLLGKQVL